MPSQPTSPRSRAVSPPRFFQALIGIFFVVLLLSSGCEREPQTMRVEIDVTGMTCETCVTAITYEVGRLEGVEAVHVDLEAGTAEVTFKAGAVEPAAIEKVIEDIGYEAELGEPKVLAPGE